MFGRLSPDVLLTECSACSWHGCARRIESSSTGSRRALTIAHVEPVCASRLCRRRLSSLHHQMLSSLVPDLPRPPLSQAYSQPPPLPAANTSPPTSRRDPTPDSPARPAATRGSRSRSPVATTSRSNSAQRHRGGYSQSARRASSSRRPRRDAGGTSGRHASLSMSASAASPAAAASSHATVGKPASRAQAVSPCAGVGGSDLEEQTQPTLPDMRSSGGHMADAPHVRGGGSERGSGSTPHGGRAEAAAGRSPASTSGPIRVRLPGQEVRSIQQYLRSERERRAHRGAPGAAAAGAGAGASNSGGKWSGASPGLRLSDLEHSQPAAMPPFSHKLSPEQERAKASLLASQSSEVFDHAMATTEDALRASFDSRALSDLPSEADGNAAGVGEARGGGVNPDGDWAEADVRPVRAKFGTLDDF